MGSTQFKMKKLLIIIRTISKFYKMRSQSTNCISVKSVKHERDRGHQRHQGGAGVVKVSLSKIETRTTLQSCRLCKRLNNLCTQKNKQSRKQLYSDFSTKHALIRVWLINRERLRRVCSGKAIKKLEIKSNCLLVASSS